MPKKKLTKAQVKRKMATARNALYDLYLDKFGYGSESIIPISFRKLEEMYNPITRAFNKMGFGPTYRGK